MAAALGTACCVAASSGVARVHRSSSPSSGGPRFAVRRQRGARLTVASTSGREETSSDVSTAVRSAQRAPAKAVRLPIAQIAAVAGLLALVHPDASFAEGLFGGGDDDMYIYTTKDLAVDVVSPLAAWKVVTAVLKQESPLWLDVIIYTACAAAAAVVLLDINTLDAYLV